MTTQNDLPTTQPATPPPGVLPEALMHRHVADIVEYLNEQPLPQIIDIIESLPLLQAIDVLDYTTFDAATSVMEALPIDRAVALLEGMSADRAADVLGTIKEPRRSELQDALTPETRRSLQHLLSYPEGTAGSLMTTEFVSVPADWTVTQTLDHIRAVEASRETIYAVFVVDPVSRKLLHVVRLRQLISANPHDTITSLAQ